MGKRNWEYSHYMTENGIYAHIQSAGSVLTVSLNAKTGIIPAIHGLDWIFQHSDEARIERINVIEDPDLESKAKSFSNGPHLDCSSNGGYNFILIPQDARAKIEDVLAGYMELLKKPGHNGRPSLLIKTIPSDDKEFVIKNASRGIENAVIASDQSFICLRRQRFKGGLQEALSYYRLANLDSAFVF